MNAKKVRCISQIIFQSDGKRCQHSAYMNWIVRMMTLSKKIFCMSRMVSRQMGLLSKFWRSGQIHKIAKIADDFYVPLKGYASDP
jgi:hypothetical protein